MLDSSRIGSGEDPLVGGLHSRLFDEAERVRWRMIDVPWGDIDKAKVSPGLIALVREATYAELTTFSATRRFLQEFADDADLSQWMSVWFYEETKHPQVLMRWLSHFGESCDERFVSRGRVTAPFMKSRFGTLVTNVISELVASNSYLSLHRHSSEPVLAQIAKNLAADEARHASSFYAFARKMLQRTPAPDALRLDGLKVLYMWFVENDRVAHPVNEFHGRAAQQPATQDTLSEMRMSIEPVNRRAFRMIGTLLGLSIESADDIRAHMATLLAADGVTHGPT
jgi:Fatty acid desaturase